MPVYRRSDLVIVRGDGCYLIDDKGRRYLDFATGIAVNALGHNHPHLVAALKRQADVLWHCSNLYRIPEQERLATRLADISFAESIFFCSSGTEAVEAGVKLMRRYHYHHGNAHKNRIITFEGGFHGRTMLGISAGGNEKAREGFAPLLDGFDRVAFADIAAVRAAITPQTAGILIEAVQGEGGIRVAPAGFLQQLRALADEHGLLLMMDEVQCGMGRCGTLFAFEQAGIVPDVVSVAKGIGGGFPLAAMMATHKAAAGMTPGSHGSTYGSNPLAMSVGNAVLDVLTSPGFLEHAGAMGEKLLSSLTEIASRYPHIITEVRGLGLMLGLRVSGSNYALAERLRAAGLLTAPSVGDNVIRILPPLVIDESHIQEAATILENTLSQKE